MAKKQTRRSVSIRGSTYEMIRQYCERNGLSMSEFVEDRVATFFGNGSFAESSEQLKQLSDDELQDAARFFTF